MAAPTPETFVVDIPDFVLDELHERLRRTRWPIDPGNEDWGYGANRSYLEELVQYWLDEYDWRAHERAMNEFAHFRVEIDEVPIHFIHERGKGPNPTPLILTHGWPWTFWDFHKVIPMLTDPAAHGGNAEDSFDVIVPSLPGFGFSSPLNKTGVNFPATAELWLKLMRDVLGYDKFGAQAGDWGVMVTSQLGHKYPEHLLGVHVNLQTPLSVFTDDPPTRDDFAEDEQDRWEQQERGAIVTASHTAVHVSDPQTLAYAMHDSPVGLAAWIVERRRNWSDSGGDVERRFSKDDLITTLVLYWVTETFVTSVRYYAEAARNPWEPAHNRTPVVQAPTGVAIWPQEVVQMPLRWMEKNYNLKHVTMMPAGGHFAPMEEPELMAADVRAFFASLRDSIPT